MTIFEMIQTTSALSGLTCLMMVLFAVKNQLKAYVNR